MLECVINISEGRDLECVEDIARSAGDDLLDVHSDADHNRSVLTVIGTEASRAVIEVATARLDLTTHIGVHPRLGVVDVVPFVPLAGSSFAEAIAARDDTARWIAEALRIPVFLYGPERTLPEVRRTAFDTLEPDLGPDLPHPTAGAVVVGAREPLVAWNLWLADPDLARAREIAAELRGPGVRALGLQVGDQVQVSMNLIDPGVVGPAEIYDRVATLAPIARAELVGLIPRAVLEAITPERWAQLGLSEDATIEHRVRHRHDGR